jgi:hypothetical protein
MVQADLLAQAEEVVAQVLLETTAQNQATAEEVATEPYLPFLAHP